MPSWSRALLAALACACLVPSTAAAAGKPVVRTGAATGLSPEAATLNGAVNPNGNITTWYFQYGRTKNYGTRTTAQDAGGGTKRVPVSAGISGLRGNATYHYRLVATNRAGSTVGKDRTFKTPEAPTISTINSSANPVTVLRTLTVFGFLIGPRGGGGKQVALEANAFPYTAGFQQVGNTVVTNADGGYTFFITPFSNLQLRVVDRSDPAIVSPILQQGVAPRVRLNAGRRSKKRRVRFKGTVLPDTASSVVQIQRRTKRGGWKGVKRLLTHKRKGKRVDAFSKRFRVKRGKYRAVALPSGGEYVEGISGSVRVRRR
jgi:hypothetical protein